MKDRVAFVTGASQGIGWACARGAGQGRRARGGRRRASRINSPAWSRRSARRAAKPPPSSSTCARSDSIQAAVEKARELYGNIDILVNNAGVTRDGLAMRMSVEQWSEVLDTNLTGTFQAIQAVLPGMVRARWGRIINISSVVGLAGNPGQANYVARKRA